MIKLQLKNFGPIIDSGELSISTISMFIGPQGSGKSSVLKVLSLCSWLEKIIMTCRPKAHYDYTHYNRFIRELKNYYRLNDNYFSDDTEILYESDFILLRQIGYKRNATITIKNNLFLKRHNSTLSFIPSERNLVSAVKNVERTYRVSDFDVLYDFIYEWSKVRDKFTRTTPLHLGSIRNATYYYDTKNGGDMIHLEDSDKTFSTFYASSGLQSALPVEALLTYKCSAIGTQAPVSVEQYEIIEKLSATLSKGNPKTARKIADNLQNYHAAKLFIEEPEQNLFPESQWQLVRKVVRLISSARSLSESNDSFAVLTTHSPYVLNCLSILALASKAYNRDPQATTEIIDPQLILPEGEIKGWFINQGRVESILDQDLSMLLGDQLDGVSDISEDLISQLTDIIYG